MEWGYEIDHNWFLENMHWSLNIFLNLKIKYHTIRNICISSIICNFSYHSSLHNFRSNEAVFKQQEFN